MKTPSHVRYVISCCVAMLALVGVDRIQAADDVLAAVCNAWHARRERVDRVLYEASGTRTVPRGALTQLKIAVDGGSPDEVVPPQDTVEMIHWTLFLDFRRNWVRRDAVWPPLPGIRDIYPEGHTISVSDGVVMQRYHPELRPERLLPQLFILAPREAGYFFQPQDRPFFLAHGMRIPSPRNAGPPLESTDLEVHGYTNIDGRRLVILRTGSKSPQIPFYEELWVDMERGGAVTRWTSVQEGKPWDLVDITYKSTEYGWMTDRWTEVYYGGRDPEWIITASIQKMEVNPEWSGDQFVIEPKPGMLVQNNSTSDAYRQGEPGQPNVSLAEVRRRARVLAVQSAHSQWWIVPTVLVGFFLAVAIGLTIIRFRSGRSV